MRFNVLFTLLLFVIPSTTHAQNGHSPSINIGDPTPPLRISKWIKGTPIQTFEKGHVYVLEFWATWCRPCIAAMPHLSTLAQKYKEKVTFLGVDIYENKTTSLEKVKLFVDSMGDRLSYHVAVEDKRFTVADWIEASGEKNNGIPRTFVVNAEGKIAWIGYPKELDEVLRRIVDHDWDMKEALAMRNERKRLAELDKAANDTLYPYMVTPSKRDSAIFLINEIVSNEPKLKYAPFTAFNTFSSLLRTDPQQAYRYGKEALATTVFEEPSYDAIISSIKVYGDKSDLPAEIYQLGAEAYQVLIDYIPYPEIVDTHKYYSNMADWYWRAKKKAKAVEAIQKAIEALKSKKDVSKNDMAALQSQLQQYKK